MNILVLLLLAPLILFSIILAIRVAMFLFEVLGIYADRYLMKLSEKKGINEFRRKRDIQQAMDMLG